MGRTGRPLQATLFSRQIAPPSGGERITGPWAPPVKLNVLRRPVAPAQYCSDAYQARLGELGFLASMSDKGNCYDNAVVETFFWRTVFMSKSQAETAIAGYIDGFYNPVPRHSTLDFTSPVKFEAEEIQTV